MFFAYPKKVATSFLDNITLNVCEQIDCDDSTADFFVKTQVIINAFLFFLLGFAINSLIYNLLLHFSRSRIYTNYEES